MLRKRLIAILVPLFVTTITGSAFAAPPPPAGRSDDSEKATKTNEMFSVLRAVGQWATNLSEMAQKKAKSELVKGYARDVAASNADADAKLMRIATKRGVNVTPLDPQTEDGKSLLDRMKAEAALLDSVQGDAFDKEYMTLVTNTQQSVIHFLETNRASSKDAEVKQMLGDMITKVQDRLKTAQVILAKVYGNTI
jgi:predicted outer membrane protein